LSITTRLERRVFVVVPAGDIDAGTAPLLRSSLLDLFASGASDVVVDLSLVEFLDSTGLGVLLGAKRRAKLVRGDVTLVAARDNILKTLRITGLHKVFTIHAHVTDALTPARPAAVR